MPVLNSKTKPLFIQLYKEGVKYDDIAQELGLTKGQVLRQAKKLQTLGVISPRKSPIDSYYSSMSDEEILQEVAITDSADSAPNPLRYQARKRFGNWSDAKYISGTIGNIGGNMLENKPTKVYLIDFGDYIKIGITQQELKLRLAHFPKHRLLDFIETDLNSARSIEKELHSKLKRYEFDKIPKGLDRNGYTECFYKPDGFEKELTIELISLFL